MDGARRHSHLMIYRVDFPCHFSDTSPRENVTEGQSYIDRFLRQTAPLFMSGGTPALQACDLPLTKLKSRLIMGSSKPHSFDGKRETDGDVCMKVGYM